MKLRALPHTELEISPLAFGCMTLGGDWRRSDSDTEILARAEQALGTAREEGFTFFDHADIYAGGNSERVFRRAAEKLGMKREDMVLQSKCGIRFPGQPSPESPQRYDFSYEHITDSVDKILERLGTDYLDILVLHRPDALMEPEEIARAFQEIEEAGKVRYFGVSNFTPAQMQLLQRALRKPLVTNQIQFNVVFPSAVDAGITHGKGYTSASLRGEDILEYCQLNGIAPQAWSPLAQGMLTGKMPEDAPKHFHEAERVVAELAEKRGVSAEAILLAWILRHPVGFVPVIGTLTPERIRGCAQAPEVELTREEWYKLYLAGRGEKLP